MVSCRQATRMFLSWRSWRSGWWEFKIPLIFTWKKWPRAWEVLEGGADEVGDDGGGSRGRGDSRGQGGKRGRGGSRGRGGTDGGEAPGGVEAPAAMQVEQCQR